MTFVGTVALGLSIFEPSEYAQARRDDDGRLRKVGAAPPPERHPRGYLPQRDPPRFEDVSTGRLALRAYSPYDVASWDLEWREERGNQRLKDRVGDIVLALEAEAPALAKLVEEGRRQAEIAQREADERHREWMRREAERRRAEAMKASRAELLAIIEEWGVAERIGRFLADAERRVAELPEDERGPLRERLERARGHSWSARTRSRECGPGGGPSCGRIAPVARLTTSRGACRRSAEVP